MKSMRYRNIEAAKQLRWKRAMTSRIHMQQIAKVGKYFGGLVCTLGGVYLGNGYGASYWRFGPFDLAWDTFWRGSLLVIIGFILIRASK
jgi:hypothetical protein